MLTRGQTRLVVLGQAVDCSFGVDRDHQSGCRVRLSMVKTAQAFPEGRDLEFGVTDDDLVGVSVENLGEQ